VEKDNKAMVDQWCSIHSRPEVNFSENLSNKTTDWIVPDRTFNKDFRTCFDYSQKYPKLEDGDLQVVVNCSLVLMKCENRIHVKLDRIAGCNHRWNEDTNKLELAMALVKNKSLLDVRLSNLGRYNITSMDIGLELYCYILHTVNGEEYSYRYIQPIDIQNGWSYINQIANHSSGYQRLTTLFSSASASTLTIPGDKSSMPLVALLVVGLLIGIPLLMFYYHRNKRRHIIYNSTSDITLEEKDEFSESLVNREMIYQSQYPEWLNCKKDMIYEISAVKKGKILGKGNFGMVFEGRIRIGNAV
jgi:hypothetical protein